MNGIALPGIVGLSTLDYLAVKSTDIQQQRDEPKNGSDSIILFRSPLFGELRW